MSKTRCLLSCDWGTTNVRLRLVDLSNETCVAELQSELGTASIAAQCKTDGEREEAFIKTLIQLISSLELESEQLLDYAPVCISGMASSSIGWRDVPYAHLPFSLDANNIEFEEVGSIVSERDGVRREHSVRLVSGLRSDIDIMRGEETQAIGIYSLPQYQSLRERSVLLLPGTHSKHISVEAGAIVDFSTFMTGELYQLLELHSVLRHSVAQGRMDFPKDGETAHISFLKGLDAVCDSPLLRQLFLVRTRQVLDAVEPIENSAFLSGLLIGAELNSFKAVNGDSVPVLLVASQGLKDWYATALNYMQFKSFQVVSDTDCENAAFLGHVVILERSD